MRPASSHLLFDRCYWVVQKYHHMLEDRDDSIVDLNDLRWEDISLWSGEWLLLKWSGVRVVCWMLAAWRLWESGWRMLVLRADFIWQWYDIFRRESQCTYCLASFNTDRWQYHEAILCTHDTENTNFNGVFVSYYSSQFQSREYSIAPSCRYFEYTEVSETFTVWSQYIFKPRHIVSLS